MGEILNSGLKLIASDLAKLPPDVTKRLVVVADDKGATVGFVTRVGDTWIMATELEQRWAKQRPSVRIALKGEW